MPNDLFETLAQATKPILCDKDQCKKFFHANLPKTNSDWIHDLKSNWALKEKLLRRATHEEPEESEIWLEADVFMIVGFYDNGNKIDIEDGYLDMNLREYLDSYGKGKISDIEQASIIVNEGFETHLSHVWNQKVKYGMKIFIPSESF